MLFFCNRRPAKDSCPPAVTHVDNSSKKTLEVELEEPKGKIAFRATVVKDLGTYWIDRCYTQGGSG